MIEPAALRRRAVVEAATLGERPRDPAQRALWLDRRRSSVELIAALADWDRAVIRGAVIDVPGPEDNLVALALLRDAADRCR